MYTILKYSQLVISVLLILSIVIQARSAGLTSGQTSSASFQTARRGPEKVIFNASIVFAILFVVNSLAFLFVE